MSEMSLANCKIVRILVAPVATALVLGVVYLAAPPMGTDLSAQVARADFFAAHGWAPLDLGWYAGISPYGYSLVSPPLMAWLGGGMTGAEVLGALSAVLSTGALAVLLARTGARRPALGAVIGAGCFFGNLVSGRTTYAGCRVRPGRADRTHLDQAVGTGGRSACRCGAGRGHQPRRRSVRRPRGCGVGAVRLGTAGGRRAGAAGGCRTSATRRCRAGVA